MSPLTIKMSSPLRSGFIGNSGGPGMGGHKGDKWYIAFGMDLNAPAGTEVFSAFDGVVTVHNAHLPAADTTKEYGAQIFVRNTTGQMGGFYTHVSAVSKSIMKGAEISRGDFIGKILKGAPDHLHFALVEIVGGVNGRDQSNYKGVDLFKLFIELSNTIVSREITFNQNGSPPTVTL